MMKNRELKELAEICISRMDSSNRDFLYSKEPFQHVIIDNVLPKELALSCLDGFPDRNDKSWENTSDEDIEIKKRSNWKSEFDIPDNILDTVRIFNSSLFLTKLSEIFNIPKLIPDPYFTGGGLNITERGGLLDVHIDGNYHDASGLNRRLNVIFFLNSSWKSEWGGQFCLYDKEGNQCKKKILPNFNRLLAFETSDISYHGLPEPLNCPEEVSRKSIILYYYTKQERPLKHNIHRKPHSALWKKRGLKDKKGKIEREYS